MLVAWTEGCGVWREVKVVLWRRRRKNLPPRALPRVSTRDRRRDDA